MKRFVVRVPLLYRPSQLNRILRRLNLLGVSHVALLAHLVHRLHDDDALGQRLVLALFPAFLQRVRALVGWEQSNVSEIVVTKTSRGEEENGK